MGLTELVVIVLVIVVLFFGGKKMLDISRSAGRVVSEFKKGKLEAEKELKEMTEEIKE